MFNSLVPKWMLLKKQKTENALKKPWMQLVLKQPRVGFIHSWQEAEALLEKIKFPIIIRPSFTLGGTGGSVAYNFEEFSGIS